MDPEWIEQANAALDTWGHHPSIERVTSYTGGIQLELFSDTRTSSRECRSNKNAADAEAEVMTLPAKFSTP